MSCLLDDGEDGRGRWARAMLLCSPVVGFALAAASSGLHSPFLPGIFIVTPLLCVLVGRRGALVTTGGFVATLWLLFFWDRMRGGASSSFVIVASMTALLAGGHLLGIWHYRSCERLRRRSLEARDQTLRTYADRLRDTAALSSALAHELNNPLASVTGLAALMECDVARAPERLRLLRREVARMGTVISEYLDFARPLAPLALATVDLRELVTSVFDLVRGPASRKRLRLETPDCDALPIRCDPGKVREILLYLIQNAIEASPVGGTIAVLLGRDSRRVRIEVLDNGPGVPRDLLDVIMKPGMSTKENASGLGLTIACSFAAQHDGAIALSNREQGGLSAVVELPRTCPATDPAKVLV